MRNVRRALCALLLALPFCGMAQADIIASWQSVPMPPPPELKTFTVTDPGHTALLLLDFDTSTCNSKERPTCVASLPYVANLLSKSREANLMIVYSLTSTGTLAAVPPDIAAKGGETVVQSGVDKFFKTNLEQMLKDKGIQTVILVGTSAEGLVTYTGGEAALRGYNVVVPVDGMASVEAFAEQYVAWHMTHAPIISPKVTLTRTDMIKF